MKKNSFTFPFKSNFFKEQDPFHLVIIFFIIFFGTAVFFSIPTFYDYEKFNQKIENSINNEFKFNISNLEDISFRFVPSPHLLIRKADLKINKNETNLVSELENIKVFISITQLYSSNFKIKKIEINNANIYLNLSSLNNFIHNLKKNIVNKLIIKKSTLFFKDFNDEVILISTIKDLNYKIDFTNSKKNLDVVGNIFDLNYKFNYLLDYEKPNIQKTYTEIKNPNILIESVIEEDIYSPSIKKKVQIDTNFLNFKNTIKYLIQNNTINFNSESIKNSNFYLNGLVNLDPFHFNLDLDIIKINLIELEKLIYFIFKNKNSEFKNISGAININFKNIEDKVINSGDIKLFFENSELKITQSTFNLDDFATAYVFDYNYQEGIDQTLEARVKLNINDIDKFNKFLFNFRKNKIISNNLYFNYKYDANTNDSFISKVDLNEFKNPVEFYGFSNWQQLRSSIVTNENII